MQNTINPLAAGDNQFNKLLFELEQVNLRLLLEIKQSQMVKSQDGAAKTARQLQQSLRRPKGGTPPKTEKRA
jgi:hypothetical protein